MKRVFEDLVGYLVLVLRLQQAGRLQLTEVVLVGEGHVHLLLFACDGPVDVTPAVLKPDEYLVLGVDSESERADRAQSQTDTGVGSGRDLEDRASNNTDEVRESQAEFVLLELGEYELGDGEGTGAFGCCFSEDRRELGVGSEWSNEGPLDIRDSSHSVIEYLVDHDFDVLAEGDLRERMIYRDCWRDKNTWELDLCQMYLLYCLGQAACPDQSVRVELYLVILEQSWEDPKLDLDLIH